MTNLPTRAIRDFYFFFRIFFSKSYDTQQNLPLHNIGYSTSMPILTTYISYFEVKKQTQNNILIIDQSSQQGQKNILIFF